MPAREYKRILNKKILKGVLRPNYDIKLFSRNRTFASRRPPDRRVIAVFLKCVTRRTTPISLISGNK